jgi:hypothetical protein
MLLQLYLPHIGISDSGLGHLEDWDRVRPVRMDFDVPQKRNAGDFARPSNIFASMKMNLLHAPVFSKRHNREFQLSAAVNVGTLLARLQLLFLIGYFGTNVVFCAVSIQWSTTYTTVCQQLRNRTGILAVVNMVSNSSPDPR